MMKGKRLPHLLYHEFKEKSAMNITKNKNTKGADFIKFTVMCIYYISQLQCMIGQFNRPYYTVSTAHSNLKLFLLPKCFVIHHQGFLTFMAS